MIEKVEQEIDGSGDWEAIKTVKECLKEVEITRRKLNEVIDWINKVDDIMNRPGLQATEVQGLSGYFEDRTFSGGITQQEMSNNNG